MLVESCKDFIADPPEPVLTLPWVGYASRDMSKLRNFFSYTVYFYLMTIVLLKLSLWSRHYSSLNTMSNVLIINSVALLLTCYVQRISLDRVENMVISGLIVSKKCWSMLIWNRAWDLERIHWAIQIRSHESLMIIERVCPRRGHSGTEGGRTCVTYFAEEGVFF